MKPTKGNGREYRRVLTTFLIVCAILPLGWLGKLSVTSESLFPDFFGLWSFGRYVLSHTPATIYDDQELHSFQVGLGLSPDSIYPFFYPPWILLLLAPFGALPYGVAHCAWLMLTFAAYVAALTAWRWQRLITGLLLFAPSSAVCLLVGQNGFVTAALMLGGTRLLRARPGIAGALLGALIYKPQLALLVPFALLFGYHRRAMVGAVMSIALLSLATTLAFGVSPWGAWLMSIRGHAAALTGAGERDVLLDMMPTVTSAVRLLGGGVPMAHLAQAAGALIGLLAIWRVRARWDHPAQAVLPLATILATPFAFDYDLPMITGSVLAVIATRIAALEPFEQMELPLLLACVSIPAILPARLGAAAAIVPGTFALALWIICRKAAPRPAVTVHVPGSHPAAPTQPTQAAPSSW